MLDEVLTSKMYLLNIYYINIQKHYNTLQSVSVVKVIYTEVKPLKHRKSKWILHVFKNQVLNQNPNG